MSKKSLYTVGCIGGICFGITFILSALDAYESYTGPEIPKLSTDIDILQKNQSFETDI